MEKKKLPVPWKDELRSRTGARQAKWSIIYNPDNPNSPYKLLSDSNSRNFASRLYGRDPDKPVQGWDDRTKFDNCRGCKIKFSLVRRKHHCRKCGHIFCDSCSFKVARLGNRRICNKCHKIIFPDGYRGSGSSRLSTVDEDGDDVEDDEEDQSALNFWYKVYLAGQIYESPMDKRLVIMGVDAPVIGSIAFGCTETFPNSSSTFAKSTASTLGFYDFTIPANGILDESSFEAPTSESMCFDEEDLPAMENKLNHTVSLTKDKFSVDLVSTPDESNSSNVSVLNNARMKRKGSISVQGVVKQVISDLDSRMWGIAAVVAAVLFMFVSAVDVIKLLVMFFLVFVGLTLVQNKQISTREKRDGRAQGRTARTTSITLDCIVKSGDGEDTEEDRRIKRQLEKYMKAVLKVKNIGQGLWQDDPLEGGWSFNGKTQDVDVYIKTEGQDLYSKGIGIINAPPNVVRTVFGSFVYRKLWDDMFKEGRIIEEVDERTTVLYSRLKAVWPTSGRDCVIVDYREDLPDGTIIGYARSIEHSKAPLVADAVRCEIKCGITEFKPIDDGKRTRVTSLLASDPKGELPGWIVSMINSKSPLVVDAVRQLIEKNDSVRQKAYQEALQKDLALKKQIIDEEASSDSKESPR